MIDMGKYPEKTHDVLQDKHLAQKSFIKPLEMLN